MRREVTVGAIVTIALLTWSVVAFAQPDPGAPAACGTARVQPAGADGEDRPGLVPSARAEPGPPDPDRPGDPCDPAGAETSAAVLLGWGEPSLVEEFDRPLDGSWHVYGGTGYDGQGRRTADALRVEGGVLTITGDAEGATGGIARLDGQTQGRWEGRVRVPEGDESYHALLLLWPDANDFPVGGEIDFMEMQDPTRQVTGAYLHHGADNEQVSGEIEIDGSEWHNWAVEWTSTHVAGFVDGSEWWRVDDPALLPPGPMHLCVQLDYFPAGDGEVQVSSMEIDWVRQYALDSGRSGADPADTAGTDPAGADIPAVGDDLAGGAPPARPGLVATAVPAPRD